MLVLMVPARTLFIYIIHKELGHTKILFLFTIFYFLCKLFFKSNFYSRAYSTLPDAHFSFALFNISLKTAVGVCITLHDSSNRSKQWRKKYVHKNVFYYYYLSFAYVNEIMSINGTAVIEYFYNPALATKKALNQLIFSTSM